MRREIEKIRGYPLTTVSGLLVIILYCTFTLTSWTLYPLEYGPWTHYLSRLGNFDYSPVGAFFYNAGCVLTGITLVPFFAGMVVFYKRNAIQRLVLVLGQFLGTWAGVALLMIGIFSEDQGDPHMLASGIFFELNFTVLILVGLGMLVHGKRGIATGMVAIGVSLSSLILAIYVGGPIVEWYTVFASLGFVGIVSMLTPGIFSERGSGSSETRL